jgi:hypothetical protein
VENLHCSKKAVTLWFVAHSTLEMDELLLIERNGKAFINHPYD